MSAVRTTLRPSATAERMVGAAHGLDHAVCLYVGYGVGAGLILNGALYGGANGNAGEVGMALIGSGPERTPPRTPRLTRLALRSSGHRSDGAQSSCDAG